MNFFFKIAINYFLPFKYIHKLFLINYYIFRNFNFLMGIALLARILLSREVSKLNIVWKGLSSQDLELDQLDQERKHLFLIKHIFTSVFEFKIRLSCEWLGVFIFSSSSGSFFRMINKMFGTSPSERKGKRKRTTLKLFQVQDEKMKNYLKTMVKRLRNCQLKKISNTKKNKIKFGIFFFY